MENEVQRLKEQKKKIVEQIGALYDDGYKKRQEHRKLLNSGDEVAASKLYDEMLEINQEISRLHDKTEEIDIQIELSISPVKTGELVDLRTVGECSRFAIYLHDQPIKIGEIEYRAYHCNETLGDIGYVIDEEYRNHGYATEALSLLSEKLCEEGIPDFWISVNDENISSIRVIEKNGGKLLKNKDYLFLYVVPTKLRNLDKKSGHLIK